MRPSTSTNSGRHSPTCGSTSSVARRPGAMPPISSSIPRNVAGSMVAICSARIGATPASTAIRSAPPIIPRSA
jgi:hypothetical protein